MFEELLAALGRELGKSGIPYMIIGGQAVLLHGEPRLTRDIDITLGAAPERLPDLLAVTHRLSLKPLVEDPKDFVERTMVLPTLEEGTGIRVDFIFSITPYEQQAIERGRKVIFERTEVNFASVEDLVIHKIFSGRPVDLEDIKSVIRKNPNIDIDYVRKWLYEFQESVEGEAYSETFESLLRELE
jgi:hypothetical protein